ncbi:hypothetical protein P7C70_g5682, partial [Phenoliferia sp. Uapishka_3]
MPPTPPPGVEYGKQRSPLDQNAVDSYLSKHVANFSAPSEIQQFSFGQSFVPYLFHCKSSSELTAAHTRNPTYFVTDATGSRYVLRKKPNGKLVSKTAHAIEREYQILDCVGKTGKIPVPRMYCLCMDERVLGTPFYVMEYLEGRIFTDVRMPEIKTKEERTACWKSIVKTLADLHKLKPDEIGLTGFGSTKPFYPRQIKSLARVSKAQAAITDITTGEAVGDVPDLDFLLDWFSKNCPNGDKWEGGIVHGDFKCDNMIFHPTEPRVIGVLDWELSTLGHPLSDLANLLQPFYIPQNDIVSEYLVALRDISLEDLPIPDAETLIKTYAEAVGQPYPLPRWSAVTSFAFFRLSVILQGIAARTARGQASSAQAKRVGSYFKPLAVLAIDTIKRSPVNSKL